MEAGTTFDKLALASPSDLCTVKSIFLTSNCTVITQRPLGGFTHNLL